MTAASSTPNLQIQLPDGNIVEQPPSGTSMDVAKDISEGLARSVIAAEIDG